MGRSVVVADVVCERSVLARTGSYCCLSSRNRCTQVLLRLSRSSAIVHWGHCARDLWMVWLTRPCSHVHEGKHSMHVTCFPFPFTPYSCFGFMSSFGAALGAVVVFDTCA